MSIGSHLLWTNLLAPQLSEAAFQHKICATSVSHEQVGKILLCKSHVQAHQGARAKLSSKHIHMVQKLYPSHSSWAVFLVSKETGYRLKILDGCCSKPGSRKESAIGQIRMRGEQRSPVHHHAFLLHVCEQLAKRLPVVLIQVPHRVPLSHTCHKPQTLSSDVHQIKNPPTQECQPISSVWHGIINALQTLQLPKTFPFTTSMLPGWGHNVQSDSCKPRQQNHHISRPFTAKSSNKLWRQPSMHKQRHGDV